METTVEETVKRTICRRCAEVIYFVLEDGRWVARDIIDNDVHPCVNP